MIQKLLVPTDFSPQALNALKAAAQLARRYKADIYLLHLLEMPEVLIDGPATQHQSQLPEALYYMKLAHKKFSNILKAPFLEGIKIYETAEFDGAFEGIMTYVKKYNIDAIVMGSHGMSGIQEFFIGSNTEKVVRHSEIPVFVIKNELNIFNIRNFVFATDLQEESLEAIQEAIKFAQSEEASLHMLYVNTPNRFKTTQEITSICKGFLKKIGQKSQKLTIYNDVSVERGILNFAESIKADLIGIGTHGRKGLAHFLNGSISEDLVNHAQRPVVTFKI
ncbi:universal stress protein [Leeuwenhoekiella sp. A16]|uniref:universal stress protein n=1 Tax=unclassified Leeuwenhoekiella TaxID=2615029 RepID=UPI003A8070F8